MWCGGNPVILYRLGWGSARIADGGGLFSHPVFGLPLPLSAFPLRSSLLFPIAIDYAGKDTSFVGRALAVGV